MVLSWLITLSLAVLLCSQPLFGQSSHQHNELPANLLERSTLAADGLSSSPIKLRTSNSTNIDSKTQDAETDGGIPAVEDLLARIEKLEKTEQKRFDAEVKKKDEDAKKK